MQEPNAEALNAQYGIPGQVEFRAGPGGLVSVVITNDQGEAEIALQGAQVVAFRPRAGDPVLFRSARAVVAPGKAIRGGIPICWPWFGPHPTDPAKPQHGFARSARWAVGGAGHRDNGTTELQLELVDTPATRALWPHPFHLTCTVQVGRALTVALTTENPGDAPFQITEALHTYYQVGNIAAVAVRGLEGTPYVDKVAGGQREVQEGPVTIGGETDRVYLNTGGPCVLDDPDLHRQIHIAKESSRSTVVWNPWREKAATIADLAPEEYAQMLCVEVGNALDNAVTVAPGATHRLTMTISLSPRPEGPEPNSPSLKGRGPGG